MTKGQNTKEAEPVRLLSRGERKAAKQKRDSEAANVRKDNLDKEISKSTVDMIKLPVRKRGRQSIPAIAAYETKLEHFGGLILALRGRLDFAPSSRGWCYMLEELSGLTKDQFNGAEKVIVECRKRGFLPLDITAKDGARLFENNEHINALTPHDYVDALLEETVDQVDHYYDSSFWESQDYYVQMMVEKIDLKQLFLPICRDYRIRIANARGWSDLHSRADMMVNFKSWEERHKTPVLLYCGDFDPAGVLISETLMSNLKELRGATGWDCKNLVIHRFGLNQDFIEDNGLSWLNNLMTGRGKDLASPKHKDHKKAYVQDWLRKIGERKCEANALITRPEAGQKLCLDAINEYIDADAPEEYEDSMMGVQDEAREILSERIN